MCSKFGKRACIRAIAISLLVAACLCGADEDKQNKQGKEAAPTEVFELGPTVKAPKLVHYVEPEFSANSKEAFRGRCR